MFDEAFMLHWNDETEYGCPREESTVEVELEKPSSFVIKVMLITTHDSKKSLIHRKGEGKIGPQTSYLVWFVVMVSFTLVVGSEDPLSCEDATSSSYNDKWLVVRSKEMKSLHKNKSWELVKLP